MWIKDVIKELREIKQSTEAEFGKLSDEELRWKPSEKSWSIAECLKHIEIANNMYLNDINKKLEKAEVRTIEYPIKLSWMGRIFLLFVDPKYKWKVRAPRIFKPINENRVEDETQVLTKYLQLQNEIIETAERAIGYDHASIYTVSPLSSLLKFNIGEQFYIMMRHELRHLNQAKRVKDKLSLKNKAA